MDLIHVVIVLILIVAVIAIGIGFYRKVMPSIPPPWDIVVYAVSAILAIAVLVYLAGLVGVGVPILR